jgi:crotonobetainyl-CoA:carnitine CoA-transferase CaiB-like acyl-CoA transferase
LLKQIRAWTTSRDVAKCLDILAAAEVPAAKVQGIDDVLAESQVHARNMLLEQQHPKLGKITMPILPFHFSGCTMHTATVAPRVGQHNRSIATELGFSLDEINTMVNDGVLYSDGKSN